MKILGINPGHDGSVVLLEDGNLIFSLEAEKDSQSRHAELTNDCLSRGVSILGGAPDVLAIGGWWERNPGYFGLHDDTIGTARIDFHGTEIHRYFSSHERSHLLACYGLSPFEQGQPCYALIWEGEIGSFYAIAPDLTITRLATPLTKPGQRYAFLYELADPSAPLDSCGESYDAAGKLMALAAFGDDSAPMPAEKELIEILLHRFGDSHQTKADFREAPLFNAGVEHRLVKNAAKQLSDAMFDVFFAAAKQHLTEGWPLLIGGGCGLNCDWNSKWKDSGLFADVFVPPCANDSGSALGTAIDAQRFYTGNAKVNWSVYAGEEFEHDMPAPLDFERLPLDFDDVARKLAAGQVLAWVQGSYELGPRALGNRSILAAPFNAATRDRLNAIKERESYRPIAPVCLEEDVSEWFDWQGASPHMLYFQRVRRHGIDAVTHVDGSARLQSVSAAQNPKLHALLTAFKRQTGAGVLCNTSLNFRGKGFINRMSHLSQFVSQRRLDGMAVGDVLYSRRAVTSVGKVAFNKSRDMNWLNTKIDAATCRQAYAKEGFVIIDDILAPEIADRLHRFFHEEMPEDWWMSVCSGLEKKQALRDIAQNRERIDSYRRSVRSIRAQYRTEGSSESPLPYSFKRTYPDHPGDCVCILCAFAHFFSSAQMQDFIGQLTGKAGSAREIFASKYAAGDFLDVHNDADDGRHVALVFGFTREWHASNGGLLVVEGATSAHVVSLGFNRLVAFDVSGEGRDHWVTEVDAHAPGKRFSFSGWYG